MTVPSTVSPPWTRRSPPTVVLFGIVISNEELPLIHASVPEPMISWLSPVALSGVCVTLVPFSSGAGPMMTLPLP